MGEGLTLVAILASLAMGLAGASLFVFALRKDDFRDAEDAEHPIFWYDLEVMVGRSTEQQRNDSQTSQ